MGRAFKTLWNVFTTLMVTAVVVLAILLAGVRLVGLQVFTVLSGSMEPTYHVGSLIYVKEAEDPRALPDGTVITYMISEDTVVTHRIVTAVPDEDDPTVIRYRTKGDANDAEDGTMVHYKNIIGTPVFTIPKLGYLASYIQNPPGSYMAICFGAVFILLLFLPELLGVFLEKEDGEEGKPKKEKKAKREKKPEKEKAPKPERKSARKKQAQEDFPYEALDGYRARRPEPEFYEQPDGYLEPEIYPEPEYYDAPEQYPEYEAYTGAEAPDYEADKPARPADEDDWLAALLADVDLSDV